MRGSHLEIKLIMLLAVSLAGSRWAFGQDRSKDQAEWVAKAVARMSEENRRKYEVLKNPSFARLELLPTLPESGESPESQVKPYKVSDRIAFHLLITNTSSAKVAFSNADLYFYSRPLLLRDGESVPYRDHVVKLLKSRDLYPDERSVRGPNLPPNETYFEIIEMERWYGRLPPGRYLLTVKRRFIWGGEWLESPPITFEVVPGRDERGAEMKEALSGGSEAALSPPAQPSVEAQADPRPFNPLAASVESAIKKEFPDWKRESIPPVNPERPDSFSSNDIIIDLWWSAEAGVKVAILLHPTKAAATKVFREFIADKKAEEVVPDTGNEAYVWGFGNSVAFRKGIYTVYVSGGRREFSDDGEPLAFSMMAKGGEPIELAQVTKYIKTFARIVAGVLKDSE